MRPTRLNGAIVAAAATVAALLALSGCAPAAPSSLPTPRSLQSVECSYSGATSAGTDITRGVAVCAVYDDGSREQLRDGYEVSGDTKLRAGRKSLVTVSYQGVQGKLSVKCTTLTKAQYKRSCKRKSPEKFATWALTHPKRAIGKRVEMRGTIITIDDYSCLIPVSVGDELYQIRTLGKLNEVWNLGTTGDPGIDTDATVEGIASLHLAYPILECPNGELHDWQTVRVWGEVDRMEETYNDMYGLTYSLPVVEVKYKALSSKE